MKSFKEWLSDYLRYFVLGAIVIILLVMVFLGFKMIKNLADEPAGSGQTEKVTESEKETETQRQTETQKETPAETETKKSPVKKGETEMEKETEKTTEAEKESAAGSEKTAGGQTDVNLEENNSTETQEAPEWVPEESYEEPWTEENWSEQTEAYIPSEPVYMTVVSDVYIRSAPSYEGEILSTLYGGQTVEFLEDAGGWYKVNADGLIGYVGARFLY